MLLDSVPETPWWYMALLSGVVVTTMFFCGASPKTATLLDRKKNDDAPSTEEVHSPTSIEAERWFPSLITVPWSEADQLGGCPWNFLGCDSVEDALARIWCSPLHSSLRKPFQNLLTTVKDLKVVRCGSEDTHYAVVYTLLTGALVFGCAPLDLSVGLDLADEGLRRRRGASRTPSNETPLQCLSPFYRIHDGLGVLISMRHLPLLFTSPADTLQGSCFYVYPSRALRCEGHLVKFARVDSLCTVCADTRKEIARCTYIESSGVFEDDEEPLDFVAATVVNLTAPPTCSAWAHTSTWN